LTRARSTGILRASAEGPGATLRARGEVIDQRPQENGSHSARPRVCVVDSRELGPAYARLDRVRIDVMGALPTLALLSPRIASEYDAVLIGCTARQLLTPAFATRVLKVARGARLIAVVPSPSPEVGAQCARLGFAGLVSSDVGPRALERTVAAVIRGEFAFPRDVLNALVHSVAQFSGQGGGPDEPTLTPRQGQIVDLIAQGATDREIASRLLISQSTAHKHVQNALRRLNARTRSQLVAAARRPLVST
jgi:DNA-binding NarL/FixJ family response regulator